MFEKTTFDCTFHIYCCMLLKPWIFIRILFSRSFIFIGVIPFQILFLVVATWIVDLFQSIPIGWAVLDSGTDAKLAQLNLKFDMTCLHEMHDLSAAFLLLL